MQLGMIGLGRMGGNIVRRLLRGGHTAVVFDQNAEAVASLVKDGAVGATSLEDFVSKLDVPRTAWVMLPAGKITEETVQTLGTMMQSDDCIIDGGNSFFGDDVRRGQELKGKGIHYVDVGTSGGVWGLERGYCMMIGGDTSAVDRLDPIFATLAPGVGDVPRTPGREGRDARAEHGYIHAGPTGAGHYVKMVHNGIEYGLMQAYARGSTSSATPIPRTCRRSGASISTSATSPRSGGGAAWSPPGSSTSPPMPWPATRT